MKLWTKSIITYANKSIVPHLHFLLAVCSIRKAPLRSHLYLRLMDLAEEPCSTKGYKVILRWEDIRYHRSRGPAIRTSSLRTWQGQVYGHGGGYKYNGPFIGSPQHARPNPNVTILWPQMNDRSEY